MPDLGDTVTATLSVSPHDVTTSAALAAHAPDGTTVTTPAPTTADGGATWTAVRVYDQPGWWLLTWTVTGTGAGIEHQQVFVPDAPTAGGPTAYTTLSLVKASLVADGKVPALRDELLLEKISSASRSIDEFTGRRFWLDPEPVPRTIGTRGRMVRDRSGIRLLVDDIGHHEVDVDGGSVDLDPPDALVKGQPVTALIRPSWPERVTVTARWGWPAIPQVVREATLIQAIRLFKRKDSAEGVLGSAEWGAVRVSRMDPDVQALIGHLVKHGLA